MAYNDVLITISNQTIVEKYSAKSYPMFDRDKDGRYDRYEIPIYKVFISGKDSGGFNIVKTWTALRFMPYWNDPKSPDKRYKSRGFISAGLHSFPKQVIKNYIRGYEIHNTYSEYNGAIQLKGNFLIHAGPKNLSDQGWGGAGCVEVIGDFSLFKKDILSLANCSDSDLHSGMESIVKSKKLFVEILHAAAPIFKQSGNFFRKQL